MNDKKKRKGGISFNIVVDKETGEIEEEYIDKSDAATPKQKPNMAKPAPESIGTDGEDPIMKALLSFSDNVLQGEGFVPWTPWRPPKGATLGVALLKVDPMRPS